MTIFSLWLPIIVSAVVSFIAGAVIWMAMPWHKSDWRKTGDEEAVRGALRNTPPGMYTLPNCPDNASFNNPEMQPIVVDFPAPFGPRRPKISPGSVLKLISSTATNSPNVLRRRSTSITEHSP